jgi:hypothetical protein
MTLVEEAAQQLQKVCEWRLSATNDPVFIFCKHPIRVTKPSLNQTLDSRVKPTLNRQG